MKKMLILRGIPGSTKSTTIEKIGLKYNKISADEIRLLLSGPVLNKEGNIGIENDFKFQKQVFNLFFDSLEKRLLKGETIVVDLTNTKQSDFNEIVNLGYKHRYKIACLDFFDYPFEQAVYNNNNRDPVKRVSMDVMLKMQKNLHNFGRIRNKGVQVISWDKDNKYIENVLKFFKQEIFDYSNYSSVIHIGDLQGCYSVLFETESPLRNGLKDDIKYIFVGDLLDRGIENGKLLRWFIDHAIHRDNVELIFGNHEVHLHRWARNLSFFSNEFQYRTLPQLLSSSISTEEVNFVCDKAVDYIMYNFNNHKVFVTHAGLSNVPEDIHLLSSYQMYNGTGRYEDPVDEQFLKNSINHEWIQVHGHRNSLNLDVIANNRSINLEDSVEFGGNLRMAILNKEGWTPLKIRNKVYRSLKERTEEMETLNPNDKKLYPNWVSNNNSNIISDDILEKMRNHKGINEKSSESYPDVVSFNFTRDIFYDQAWDDMVIKARGFFVDKNDHSCVARGYEKFFNTNETKETNIHSLRDSIKFPLRGYLKENGFLGNTGYHQASDTLFVASKSTPDGPFAGMFNKLLDEQLGQSGRELLKRYLRDTGSSATFEVIDIVDDPHIIEYEKSKVVLLDIIHRSIDFKKSSYENVIELSKKLNIECKQKAFEFKNFESFSGWFKSIENDLDYKFQGKNVEGFVFEDQNGFMFKVKLPFYGFWKQMRSVKQRVYKEKEKNLVVKPYVYNKRPNGQMPSNSEVELANSFYNWCQKQDLETLGLDIVALRNSFLVNELNIVNEDNFNLKIGK